MTEQERQQLAAMLNEGLNALLSMHIPATEAEAVVRLKSIFGAIHQGFVMERPKQEEEKKDEHDKI